MVQNNKVLTVSYGTFSCTLEGFDDSFDTMKAIAEYFRDLASDDRYFGAEPPQPDAEMLARIAQREISRQVEAHHDSKGITLRAAEADSAPLAASPAPAQQAAEIAPASTVGTSPEPEIVTEQPTPVETVEEEPVAEITPPQEDDLQPQAEDDSVDVDEDASVEDALEQEPTVEDSVEPVEAQDFVEAAAEVIEEPTTESEPVEENVVAPAADVTIESIAAQLETETDEAPEIEAEIPEAEVLEEPEIVPSSDSIAAKLQRIRAVVSRNEQSTDEADYSEDEHAEDLTLNRNQIIEEAQSDDDISSILENVEQASDTTETPTEGDVLFSDLDTDSDSQDPDKELMNILGEPEEPIAPVNKPRRVRVIKVKNTDFENAVSSGDVEQVEAEVEDEAPQAKEQRPTAASLSPEDEEDLLRELAAVEAELKAKANQEDDAEAEEEEAAQIEEEAQSIEEDASIVADAAELIEPEQTDASPKAARQSAPENTDDDLSRLMEAADQKLDDPDLSTNRDTYSHLRAAVAAAEAERSAGGTVGTESSDDVYREDLAAVVRPRRPAVGSGRSRPRAEAEKPAPLKLVAEQRVDTSEEPTTNRGPVRPRRVPSLSVDETETSDAGGFAQYAAENGATTLPEMLEAAAAYMSFVENRDQFSRPQLMNKVRQLQVESFNREDGLRTFGQLLRDGKIEKTGGGRFTASGQIGFQPDSRAAG
jgi:hypothetical protein